MSPAETNLNAKMAGWPLAPRFKDLELERQFRSHDCVSTISLARFCYFNAVFIWGLFGILDASMSADKTTALWSIRFVIGEPVLLVALAATFIRPLWPWLKLIGLAVTFVLGACVLWMLVVLGPPLSLTYYAGIILVLFPAYVFAQVRFFHAVAVSLVLLSAYWLFTLTTNTATPTIAVATLTFITTTVYIGLVACLLLEWARRREFAHLRVIARNNDHFKRQSARDDLTRLFNRRRLHQTLEEAIEELSRNCRRTAIMMIDIDNFKLVNDGFGHATGDRVLIEAAASITDCIKPADSAFRIGGDEFVVLLPTTTALSAASVALNIMGAFSARCQLVLAGRALPTGMSIGVAQVRPETKAPSDLLEIADDALYQAKRCGKGRVHVAIEPTNKWAEEEEETHYKDGAWNPNRDSAIMQG